MSKEVKVPTIGESITEVTISSWLKSTGDYVELDEPICEIESDKASLEMPSPFAGVITLAVEEGDDVAIGAVVATIDTDAKAPQASAPAATNVVEASTEVAPAAVASIVTRNIPSPAAKKILAEKGVDSSSVSGSGKDGRITKADAHGAQVSAPKQTAPTQEIAAVTPNASFTRGSTKTKMSRLRKTIAKRLVEVKNETAMLTTFNEVDMSAIMELRKKYKDQFKDVHGIGLGFMSFFTKACTIAAKRYPLVNGQVEDDQMITFDYVDMGIAVSSEKGLVVPVVRNAESLTLAEIESEIRRLALKARDGKLSIDEMQGGTFTITNGGVFGSMLSTPILNSPQSAILGMHNIVERAWPVNGEVKIRPIMYLALSYDHRIVDGKESVGFLKTVKELLEDPTRFLLGF
jgi:2-oxoglutarate dehydrogenase E2 component (dihydrolipoamide succinyltransferase)